tara:strand:+ start:404 stop:826 length:423 start_codon:yes stop_codon:yes gene_type:complete
MMFSRDYLAGMLYAKAQPVIRVSKNADSALGYRVTMMVNFKLRGKIDEHHSMLLKAMQRTLLQNRIESTINKKGLTIARIDSIDNLMALMLIAPNCGNNLPLEYRLGGRWEKFARVWAFYSVGEHLTQDGLNQIIEILGV